MIIIMPDNHKGLDFFRNAALRGFDDPDVANILDDALFVLDEKRKVSSAEEHIITMPAFTVDSNIDGKKHFREVKNISKDTATALCSIMVPNSDFQFFRLKKRKEPTILIIVLMKNFIDHFSSESMQPLMRVNSQTSLKTIP